VGLIDTIENKLLDLLKSFLKPVLDPLAKLWGLIKSFATALIDVIPDTIKLVNLVIAEVLAWRTFKEGINFKSGVVNLQSAKDRLQQIIDEIISAWNALKGLFTDGFKLPLKSVNEMADAAEELVVAFEDFFGKFGLQELLQKLSGSLKKAGGKVLEVLALLEAVAEAALRVVHQLTTIVQAIKDIRETFQTGEGLFLQQKNPRKIVKLADGSSIKLRLGNLHDG